MNKPEPKFISRDYAAKLLGGKPGDFHHGDVFTFNGVKYVVFN